MLETANKPAEIPSPWEELDLSKPSGTMMIVGTSEVNRKQPV